MPTRGKARKIGVRVDRRPVASARQNGELHDSASSSGMCTRIPLATWIALSGPSMPTCTWTPKISSWRATKRSDEVAVARAGHDPLVLPHGERMRSRRPQRKAAVLRSDLRNPSQLLKLEPGLARVPDRSGGDLEHRLHKLGLDVTRRL